MSASKPLTSHKFRSVYDPQGRGWYRIWECECGLELGRQPECGQQRARARHRKHKDELRSAVAPVSSGPEPPGPGDTRGTSGSSSGRPAWPSTSPAPGNLSLPVVEATEAPDVPPTHT